MHTPDTMAINELLSGCSWRSIKNHIKYEPEIRKAIQKVGNPLRNAFANTAIIVYQEQIMMLSRLIANFDRGESDLLRKALGKRKMDVLSVLKPRFIEGGIKEWTQKECP